MDHYGDYNDTFAFSSVNEITGFAIANPVISFTELNANVSL